MQPFSSVSDSYGCPFHIWKVFSVPGQVFSLHSGKTWDIRLFHRQKIHTSHAWQNPSPGIFPPVFSPLFGFHSRTAGWQNIFRTVPCSQSLISASIPPGSYGGVLFLPAASLAVSGTCPADRYSHLPYSLYRISANVFLIYNAEIPLPVPGKISGKPLPDLTVHSPAQENPPLSAMDILFYIRPAYFSASFFLPDNNGSYPQASGYRENDCSQLSSLSGLSVLYLDRSLFLLPGLSFSP